VYDEMPTLRSDRHEAEAPGSVHVCSLWLEIDTHDCQQVESLQCDVSLRSNGWRWRHFPCWTGPLVPFCDFGNSLNAEWTNVRLLGRRL
jgi:hypothetical protein